MYHFPKVWQLFTLYRNFQDFLIEFFVDLPLCSIFSNSGHVGWSAGTPDTILKLDTLRMIVAKFGSHWPSGFRGEDF